MLATKITLNQSEVRGGPCNPSYWEDGIGGWLESLETVGALGAATPILESISNPSVGADWSWVGFGCQKDLISDQIPTCLVPRIGGIKYSCNVVLELNRPKK